MKDKNLFYYTVCYFVFCWPFLIKNYDFSIIMFCLLGISLSCFIKQKNIKIKKGSKILFTLFTVAFFYKKFGTFRGIEPSIALLSMMAVGKSLELKTKRDYCIFLLIVKLIVMGNILIVESLFYILFVIISTFILFYLLFLIHCEKNLKLTWKLKKTYIGMFLAALLTSIPLFFIFPRLNIGFLNISNVTQNSATGFTEELRPGEIAKLYKSNETIFSVVFEEKVPPQESLYWRGEVLGDTDGINWKKEKADRKYNHYLDEKSIYKYTVLFAGYGTGQLFNLQNIKSIEPISRFHYVETSQGIFKAFPLSKKKFSYKGTITKIKRISTPKNLNRYLQTNTGPSPRLKKLIADLSLGNDTLEKKIVRIDNFLKGNEFVYTYGPGTYKKENFLDEFFFTRKKGFCGHFASATAVLMRFLGIPSRVIIGFQGGTQGHLNNFLIKARDAHSWIEYWNDKKGWVRFDPTLSVAPERITMSSLEYIFQESEKRERESYIIRAVKQALFQTESLYYSLNNYFLNYDLDAQKAFFKGIFNLAIEYKALLLGIFVIVAAFITVYFFSPEEGIILCDPYRKLYLKVLKKLKKKGVHIRTSDGPKDVLSNSRPFLNTESFKKLKGIILRYIKLRYGAEKNFRESKEKLVKLVKDF